MIPHNKPLESVRSAASARTVTMRRQASSTVVSSDMVNALESLNFLTVLSPVDSDLSIEYQKLQ